MEWLPQESPLVGEVVSAYIDHVGKHYGPAVQAQFVRTYTSDQQAGVAEAVAFTWLAQTGRRPERLEDPSFGGMDFVCRPRYLQPFAVEATSLGQAPLSNKTGWSNDLDNRGGSFALPIEAIQARIRKKIPQLAKHPMPRVLAIVTSHVGADAFMSGETATHLLLGGYKVKVSITEPFEHWTEPSFENSVFIQRDELCTGGVVAVGKSLSAILLIALNGASLSATGILHPEPYFPIDPQSLAEIPIYYISPWPPQNGQIHIDQTIDDYPIKRFDLAPLSV